MASEGGSTQEHTFSRFFSATFPNNKQSKTDQLDAAFFSNFSYQLPHTIYLGDLGFGIDYGP